MSFTEDPARGARLTGGLTERSGRRRPARARVRVPWMTRRQGAFRLALVVRWDAANLDRALATGVSPLSSDALALRARRITGRRRRATVARGLARVMENATEQRVRFTAAVSPDRAEVLAARSVIDALECRLRGHEPIAARGMAMLSELLTEPTSPLYLAAGPGVLAGQLRAAAAALEPGSRWR